MNRKGKNTAGILRVLALICAAVLSLSACAQPEAETEPTKTVLEEAAQEENNFLEIETPYCVMQYPAYWEDALEIRETEDGGVLEDLFCCNMDGKQYQLFAVRFGEGAEGDIIGYLMHQEQKVPVSIEVFEFTGDSELAEENEMAVYAMQEGINDILQSVMANEAYSAE